MTRNIALIVGSLRKDSYTRKVAHAIVELAPESMNIEQVEIGHLPLYNQDLDGDRPPLEWSWFRDRIRPMDGILIATPEYNRSIPGGLKNAIDVGSRPYGKSVFAGKPCAIVSVTPGMIGGFGANHHLRQSAVFLDMPVLQQPEMYISQAHKLFDDQGKLVDDKARDLFRTFINAFAAWVDRFAVVEKKRSAA
jgi:chromate reductase